MQMGLPCRGCDLLEGRDKLSFSRCFGCRTRDVHVRRAGRYRVMSLTRARVRDRVKSESVGDKFHNYALFSEKLKISRIPKCNQ